jgi:hypothetical protein
MSVLHALAHSSSLISKSSVNFLYDITLFSLSFLCLLIEWRRDSGILQCVSLYKLKSFLTLIIFIIFFYILNTSFTPVVCYTFYYFFIFLISYLFTYVVLIYTLTSILIFFSVIFNCFIESIGIEE